MRRSGHLPRAGEHSPRCARRTTGQLKRQEYHDDRLRPGPPPPGREGDSPIANVADAVPQYLEARGGVQSFKVSKVSLFDSQAIEKFGARTKARSSNLGRPEAQTGGEKFSAAVQRLSGVQVIEKVESPATKVRAIKLNGARPHKSRSRALRLPSRLSDTRIA